MSFAADLEKFALKVKGLANETVAEVVKGVALKIDERSPVDTGHFRGNWQLDIGSLPSGIVPGVDPDGSGLDGRVTSRIPADAAGKVYYIANNLPYAQRLEHGWSKQAPQGIVGRTVVEWQDIVDRAVAQVRS